MPSQFICQLIDQDTLKQKYPAKVDSYQSLAKDKSVSNLQAFWFVKPGYPSGLQFCELVSPIFLYQKDNKVFLEVHHEGVYASGFLKQGFKTQYRNQVTQTDDGRGHFLTIIKPDNLENFRKQLQFFDPEYLNASELFSTAKELYNKMTVVNPAAATPGSAASGGIFGASTAETKPEKAPALPNTTPKPGGGVD